MTKRFSPYSFESVPDSNADNRETDFEVPIIDVVRHGPTEYKELRNKDFKFDPTARDFALDEKHLDLTAEGINSIHETANQLISRINKEKEAVLILTSPNFRAHSSALIIEHDLREAGVPLLGDCFRKSPPNAKRRVRTNQQRIAPARNLRQVGIGPNMVVPDWVKADASFRAAHPSHINAFPWDAYQEIARRMGKDLSEIFTEGSEKIDLRFNRFVRHINNLYRYLGPETRKRLKGKRLRVIALTHEEVPAVFTKDTLGHAENVKKGQILEIRPEKQMLAQSKVPTGIELVAKSGSKTKSGRVIRKFEA